MDFTPGITRHLKILVKNPDSNLVTQPDSTQVVPVFGGSTHCLQNNGTIRCVMRRETLTVCRGFVSWSCSSHVYFNYLALLNVYLSVGTQLGAIFTESKT